MALNTSTEAAIEMGGRSANAADGMGGTAGEAAVELVGVTKRFGATTAVKGLTLRIPRGSAFGFLGPNGAGKTTTIKLLLGLLRRDGGHLSVLGNDPDLEALNIKQRVGYVPEQQFIYRWMRVGEAIDFCRSIFGRWNEQVCADLLRLFGLKADQKVRQLSKGTVVKLALVLALAHEPELLVLDEPMAGLDPVAREELLDGVLRVLGEREQTLIFSSHQMGDVQRLADTVGIIHEGQLLIHGPVDELLTGTKRIRAVLRDGRLPSAAPEGTIWQRRQNREWLLTVTGFTSEAADRLRADEAIERIEVADLGLEEIFKDLIRGRRAGS